jgi:NAD-specific glutamate dehydrogenase
MENKTDEYIHIIMLQTNYSQEEALTKLNHHNGNHINVIKEYMGIPIEQKTKKIKSINQEIYSQIRKELDSSMRAYNNKNPINIEHAISNLQESESKLHNKK